MIMSYLVRAERQQEHGVMIVILVLTQVLVLERVKRSPFTLHVSDSLVGVMGD